MKGPEYTRLWDLQESLWLLRMEKDYKDKQSCDWIAEFLKCFPYRSRRNVRRHLASKARTYPKTSG